jgi:hypothetical protein
MNFFFFLLNRLKKIHIDTFSNKVSVVFFHLLENYMLLLKHFKTFTKQLYSPDIAAMFIRLVG